LCPFAGEANAAAWSARFERPLALLAIIAFGVGFTVHWLFVVAVVLALLWLISLFLGGSGGRTRTTWW
jgi:hypothetical protein